MSYLSMLEPELREQKEQQLKRVLDTKPDLFRNLNIMTQKKQLEQNTQNLLNYLPETRRKLYEELYEKFAASLQILDIKEFIPQIEIPNDNKISFVPLFNNTLGENHYALVYLDLMLNYEVNGDIIPVFTKVFETSSGSGGIACSKVAKELGYECIIAIPGGGEKARENAIKDNGAELILTDNARYTNGFPMFIKRFLIKNREEIENKKMFFLNHSQGKQNGDGIYENNTLVIEALSKIGYTILSEFKNKGEHLDYFVSGIGNGTNTLGIGGPLHLHGTKIIGFEPFESAMAYQKLYPGKYEELFGMTPGELGRHSMPGLSPSNNEIYLPHIENSIDMLEDDYLIASKKSEENYMNKVGRQIPEGGALYYDANEYDLSELGRSTKGGFYAAMKLAEKIKDNHILILGYDKGNRYDDYNLFNKSETNSNLQ